MHVRYLDFWLWIVKRYKIHNGCVFNLDLTPKGCDNEPAWVQVILGYIRAEYPGEEKLTCWVSW